MKQFFFFAMASLLTLNDDITNKLKSTEFIEKYKINARLCLQVYLDLKLLKEWKYIDIKVNEKLNICYLIGRKSDQV